VLCGLANGVFHRTGTSLPINKVSVECGFENSSDFSQVFKEKTNITASAWSSPGFF